MTNTVKTLRFKAGKDLEFFSTLRSRVDAYFTESKISPHANPGMVLKSIVLIAGYILPFAFMLAFQPPVLVCIALWLLMGLALAGIGMSVMHDANHGAYSGNERTNRNIGYILNLLGGSSFNWKIQHNLLHHTYTNITGHDEDITGQKSLRFSPHTAHKKMHKHQWYYAFVLYGVLTLYWGVAKDMVQYINYKRKGLNKNKPAQNRLLLFKITALKLVYFFSFLVLPLLVSSIPYYQILIGFLLMHITAGVILSVVFQLAHTIEETEFPVPDDLGAIDHAWAVHQMKTTADFSRNNKLMSWYVGGLNFQVEHHLFPKICHVHYPQISPIVEATAKEYGVPFLDNVTFARAFKSHVAFLKKMGVPHVDEIMG
ncbi:MAG: fatty acid desaturase family protein [Flavobacteriales bacterium]